MWNLKKGYSENIYNTEVESDVENQHVYWDGGGALPTGASIGVTSQTSPGFPIPKYPTCPTPYQKKSMELPFSDGVVGVR